MGRALSLRGPRHPSEPAKCTSRAGKPGAPLLLRLYLVPYTPIEGDWLVFETVLSEGVDRERLYLVARYCSEGQRST